LIVASLDNQFAGSAKLRPIQKEGSFIFGFYANRKDPFAENARFYSFLQNNCTFIPGRKYIVNSKAANT